MTGSDTVRMRKEGKERNNCGVVSSSPAVEICLLKLFGTMLLMPEYLKKFIYKFESEECFTRASEFWFLKSVKPPCKSSATFYWPCH